MYFTKSKHKKLMCGITGFFSFNNKFSEAELHEMTDSIHYRGPDSFGYYYDKIVGLGHRRLSILDLSDRANQPMHSEDNSYAMVYNGEVYNFQEIATELKQRYNKKFRTSSDSEIILEAFAEYGNDFVKKLNGMFAIAIYDKISKSLHIFRDRMGIKPLYYYWDGENFAFASEPKAFKKLKSIPLEIDKNAVFNFLHLGFIPSPLSIYQSVKKLESGTWIRVSKNKLETTRYWSIDQKISEKVVSNEKEAIVKLSDLIMSSVQYQVQSDVPYGVFLSGGIDSSLVTANAARLSGVKVNTFSIGFKENKFDESVYAKAIANYLGTNHHEFIVSSRDAMDLIETTFADYSEPFADSSSMPTMLVSKLASQYVTVVLSGEGGDELFLGYGAYRWAKRLNNPLIKLGRHQIAALLNIKKQYRRHSEYFLFPDQELLYSHILSQEQYYFSLNQLDDLLTDDFSQTFGSKNIDLFNSFGIQINRLNRTLNPMERQAIFDLSIYMQDDLLTKVDLASMSFSIEARVPYLDHRIVEFALNLSPHLKFKDGVSKYLLKEILYQYVPKKYFDRPKQGFAIPLIKWLKNELSYLIDDYLSEKIITQYNIVNYKVVQQMIKDYRQNNVDYLYNKLWVLIVLHKWLIKNDF
jgi:asparagine synthase (glutamine-hydrolysing)